MLRKYGWSYGSHHTKPPPSQHGSSFKIFSSFILAAKWLVRPSSTSPKKSDDLLPSFLSDSSPSNLFCLFLFRKRTIPHILVCLFFLVNLVDYGLLIFEFTLGMCTVSLNLLVHINLYSVQQCWVRILKFFSFWIHAILLGYFINLERKKLLPIYSFKKSLLKNYAKLVPLEESSEIRGCVE